MGIQMIVCALFDTYLHNVNVRQATLTLHFTMYFLPESPRWLVQQDRHEEAYLVLAKLHAGGNINDPQVQIELSEISAKIAFEKLEPTPSYFTLLFGSERRRMWIGIGVVSDSVCNTLSTI